MATKQNISARETYVLDDDALEELDEISLTGVMRDVTESIRKLEFEQEREAAALGGEDLENDEFDLGFLIPDD